jgi:hypothetical protein
VSDRTYARDVESTGFARSGLPDSPELEREWSDALCRTCGAAIRVRVDGEPVCTRCARDPQPPSGGALFPEVVTWADEQLITAIELADRREPALRLASPADYNRFLDRFSAEPVSRLERGVAMAA